MLFNVHHIHITLTEEVKDRPISITATPSIHSVSLIYHSLTCLYLRCAHHTMHTHVHTPIVSKRKKSSELNRTEQNRQVFAYGDERGCGWAQRPYDCKRNYCVAFMSKIKVLNGIKYSRLCGKGITILCIHDTRTRTHRMEIKRMSIWFSCSFDGENDWKRLKIPNFCVVVVGDMLRSCTSHPIPSHRTL